MQCQKCNGRNPSDAHHCLHCGESIGGRQPAEEGDPKRLAIYLFGTAALFIGLLSLFFGFDTNPVECTELSSKIAEFEAKPEWTRDTFAERTWKKRQYRRMHKEEDVHMRAQRMYPDLRCYVLTK